MNIGALIVRTFALSALAGVALEGCSSTATYVAPTTALPAIGPTLQASARYALSPTFTALVVPGYLPGRESDLLALAKVECASKRFCAIGVWTDDASTPKKLKMSADQVSARQAQFVIDSATGMSRALWRCQAGAPATDACL